MLLREHLQGSGLLSTQSSLFLLENRVLSAAKHLQIEILDYLALCLQFSHL